MVCKNCNDTLLQQYDYCGACGGKVIRNRLTMKNLFADFSQQFLNYDNTLLKTFTTLFKKPEDVIGGYISGMRKRYFSPISYLAFAITIGGLYMLVLNRYFPNALTEMSTLGGAQGQEEVINETVLIIQKYYSLTMILMIPLYALISRLVFSNRKDFNYTEHIIISMYIVAQFSLVSSFINIVLLALQLPSGILSSSSIFLQIAYFSYCFKRLYKLSYRSIVLKMFLFLGILVGVFIILFILGVILAILLKILG